MTAPEKETVSVFRAAMTEDPQLEGGIVLMLTKIMPALQHVRDYGSEVFPDDDAECATWTNAAIFGAVAHYVTTQSNDAQLSEITKVYACISEVISSTLDTYGRFDLEHYAQDFLERVGAEEIDAALFELIHSTGGKMPEA